MIKAVLTGTTDDGDGNGVGRGSCVGDGVGGDGGVMVMVEFFL